MADSYPHTFSPRAYIRHAIESLRWEIAAIDARGASRSGDRHRLAQAVRELAIAEVELAALEELQTSPPAQSPR